MSTAGFTPVILSLEDILGVEAAAHIVGAAAALGQEPLEDLCAAAACKVDFFPETFRSHLHTKLAKVGRRLVESAASEVGPGAPPEKFKSAAQDAAVPLSGLGYFRVGADGRLYFIAKSEHYHASLGHRFPGYQLIDHARRLGLPNATHNNTRGMLTRLLEAELVAAANGLKPGHAGELQSLINADDLYVMNRVLNLNTGSLAAEAALKMCLARFYAIERGMPGPKYTGRKPVFLVMASDDGQPLANYHGTTVFTQMMRGMWPELSQRLEEERLFTVCALRPNDYGDLERAFDEFDFGPNKIAGFFHEIVLMNYGARLLESAYLQRAYQLCQEHDVPTVVDEIQSGIWAPDLFLFREYGLRPSAVVVGKGFPGGEYSASRIIFSSVLDTLPQFGALVTNGQEELGALAYLVTMRWARANQAATRAVGDYYEQRLRKLQDKSNGRIVNIEGNRHLCGIRFADHAPGAAFVQHLVDRGIDISMQGYKQSFPPVVLTKLPLIADHVVVDYLIEKMQEALQSV